MKLIFVKLTGRWFADIEPWDYDRIMDLQMVDGADTMLDELSIDGQTVTIEVLTHDEDPEVTLAKYDEDESGAYYYILSDRYTIKTDTLWLCNVCKEIFGSHPDFIDFNLVVTQSPLA